MENKNSESINESNSAKRLKMLGDSTSEDIHLESDKEVKGSFWGNIWYRHKWAIIMLAIALVIVLLLSLTLCGREKYDVKIMYVGPKYMASNAGVIGERLQGVCEDYDGDGEARLLFSTLVYQTPEQMEILAKEDPSKVLMAKDNNSALEQFQTQAMGGAVVVFFIDPALYETFAPDALVKIEDAIGYAPDQALLYEGNEYALDLSRTDIVKYFPELSELPKDTIACVVKTVGTDDAHYEASCAWLKRLIEFKAP